MLNLYIVSGSPGSTPEIAAVTKNRNLLTFDSLLFSLVYYKELFITFVIDMQVQI